MLNPYGREDIENLLVQLKQYKRIIQSYQENDISHDYFRLKSEFREIKSRFLETKQMLLQLEEKHKECLFEYHKLIKERDDLQQELTKLKKETNNKRNNNGLYKLPQGSFHDKDIKMLVEVIIYLLKQRNNGIPQLNPENTKPEDRGDEEVSNFKESKNIGGGIVQSLNLIDNSYSTIFNGKEMFGKMDTNNGNNENQPESLLAKQSNKTIDNLQFNHEFIKGAEPNTEIDLISPNENKIQKDTKKMAIPTNQSETKQVNSTISSIQSQSKEIKSPLKDIKNQSTLSPKQYNPNSFLQQAISKSQTDQGREFTFRDLQNASNVSQVIGKGSKEKVNLNKSNHFGQKKNEVKSVYIRYKDDKKNQPAQTSTLDNSFNNEVSISHIEKDSLQNEVVREPVNEEKENILLNQSNDSQPENHDIKSVKVQPEEKPLSKEVIEKKSRLKLFWEKLTKY